MICHQCKQQHALGALIDHIKGAHECNASTRLIVDNVKSFQDACCFVPIKGWTHPIHFAITTEKGTFVFDGEKPLWEYGAGESGDELHHAPPASPDSHDGHSRKREAPEDQLESKGDGKGKQNDKASLIRALNGANALRNSYVQQRDANGLMGDDDDAATLRRDEHGGNWVQDSGRARLCRRASIDEARFLGTCAASTMGDLATSVIKCDICLMTWPLGHFFASAAISPDGSLRFMIPHSSTVAQAKQEPFTNVFQTEACVTACVFCMGYHFVAVKSEEFDTRGKGKGRAPRKALLELYTVGKPTRNDQYFIDPTGCPSRQWNRSARASK